jgi:hypothetical protein
MSVAERDGALSSKAMVYMTPVTNFKTPSAGEGQSHV